MKKLLENKSYGFYVTFVSVVVSIVCAAVYASMYSGSRYMEWPAVVAMLVGAAVSLVLMFTKKAGWANAVIAAADFVAFLYYVYGIYFYVSVVMVGHSGYRVQLSVPRMHCYVCRAAGAESCECVLKTS